VLRETCAGDSQAATRLLGMAKCAVVWGIIGVIIFAKSSNLSPGNTSGLLASWVHKLDGYQNSVHSFLPKRPTKTLPPGAKLGWLAKSKLGCVFTVQVSFYNKACLGTSTAFC
jgi:hypothetical protein